MNKELVIIKTFISSSLTCFLISEIFYLFIDNTLLSRENLSLYVMHVNLCKLLWPKVFFHAAILSLTFDGILLQLLWCAGTKKPCVHQQLLNKLISLAGKHTHIHAQTLRAESFSRIQST